MGTYEPGPWLPRYDHNYYPGDLVCGVALDLLRQVDGNGSYGAAGAVGPFASGTAQTLSAMAAEQKAFWASSVADFNTSSNIQGFSSTAAREYFSSFPTDRGFPSFVAGEGSWQYGGSFSDAAGFGYFVTSANYAQGLWALMTLDGATNAIVADVYPWLMSFTTNPGPVAPSDASADDIARTNYGTYDPTLALTSNLGVVRAGNPTKVNASVQYDLGSVGLLAPIQSSLNSGALDVAKKALANVVPRATTVFGDNFPQAIFDDLRLMGQCGLGRQSFGGYAVVASAAKFGLAYRVGTNFPTPVRP